MRIGPTPTRLPKHRRAEHRSLVDLELIAVNRPSAETVFLPWVEWHLQRSHRFGFEIEIIPIMEI
jgi:hypothetical protein